MKEGNEPDNEMKKSDDEGLVKKNKTKEKRFSAIRNRFLEENKMAVNAER